MILHSIVEKFYKNGIRFECQCCGHCCKTGKDYGYVYLSSEECTKIAAFIGVSLKYLKSKYVSKINKAYQFKQSKEDCPFLKENKCSIYKVRPLQCRTWPFWPENMRAGGWIKSAVAFCPGIGKGKRYTSKEIDRIINKQKKFEEEAELFPPL